jgi:transposase
MKAVGIDISKGKSMVAVMRPFGEVVFAPFEISHTDKDLTELAKTLKSLPGETRVVMEATGSYHVPVAWMLQSAGLYVSVPESVKFLNNDHQKAPQHQQISIILEIKWRSPVR